MIDLKKESVKTLSGVGQKTALALEGAGICTLYDLLCRFPRAYENHTPVFSLADTSPEHPAALILRVTTAPRVAYTPTKKRIVRFSARLSEKEPIINIAFFNQPYLVSTFHVGEDYVFWGKVVKESSGYFMFSPCFEKPTGEYSENVPVYPSVSALGPKKIKKLVSASLDFIKDKEIAETLPEEVLKEEGLVDIKTAFFMIHRPENKLSAAAGIKRFQFEELFNFSLSSLRLSEKEDLKLIPSMKRVDLEEFYKILPFELTGAQRRVIEEIEKDLVTDTPTTRAMRRLLQGDVGSGKTAVAAGAMFIALKNGYKCTIMAPTEILAQQHFTTLEKLFAPLKIPVLLLTGSTRAAERRETETRLLDKDPVILVGTHALFESGIKPYKLGLVITDEQHRFGVKQREKLLSMAEYPNSLVMSATPIPRTLAMFLYAGLDISVLDEVPKGRKKTETYLIPPAKKDRMYSFIKEQLEKGNQGYVICPLVEESKEEQLYSDMMSAPDLVSADRTYAELSKKLAPFKVGLLHGKMKPSDKAAVMQSFSKGETDLIVSTTVVEVGVDVPNATVMAIENAERFGLATLHQLRGRVGRSSKPSQCILITPSNSRDALERLSFLCRSSNGFEIAEYDLEKRGPGDFFGYRQHGDMPFVFAQNVTDPTLIKRAQESAKKYNKTIKEI